MSNSTRKMMLLTVLAAALSVPAYAVAGTGPSIADVEAKFGKLLRNTKVASIKASPVKGLYEVIAGPNVFYFSPGGEGHLVFGQILDSGGNNLTAPIQEKLKAEMQKAQEKVAIEKLKTLPLDKAVKIGSGPNTVIEFTDPDCPYCRKVDAFLSGRNDVTRYVFLFPLEQLHPQARAKSLFIHGSTDKQKAFADVFAGKYDSGTVPQVDGGAEAEATENMNFGLQAGKDMGVKGTPMLFINGQMVNGADMAKISSLLASTPR